MTATWEIRQGDALERLREMPDESVQCCVTSPPYFGLRDYGLPPSVWGESQECDHEWGTEIVNRKGGVGQNKGLTNPPDSGYRQARDTDAQVLGQGAFCRRCGAWRGCLGLEPTPELFVTHLVEVLGEVRRTLRDDGTLWLNLGDTYANRANAAAGVSGRGDRARVLPPRQNTVANGIKQKDLIGIPWMVAFALRADGWWLRSEIIWHKRNGLPGGGRVVSKPDRFHEHIFLLAKSDRYYYDADAIREDSDPEQEAHNERYAREYDAATTNADSRQPGAVNHVGIHSRPGKSGRNKRSVWRVSTNRLSHAHFATFPPTLIEPCILAGSRKGDLVLDPFSGAATTGLVSIRHGRSFVGLELNPEYVELGRQRIRDDAPLMNYVTEAVA